MTNARDHYFIFSVTKKIITEHPKLKFQGRAYSRLNKEDFVTDIVNTNWDHILTCQDSDDAWQTFKTEILKVLHKNASIKTFTNRGDSQPWINLEYLDSANERNDLQN